MPTEQAMKLATVLEQTYIRNFRRQGAHYPDLTLALHLMALSIDEATGLPELLKFVKSVGSEETIGADPVSVICWIGKHAHKARELLAKYGEE